MIKEYMPNPEAGLDWEATAERFTTKINEEIASLGDEHPRVAHLNKLESLMHTMLASYNMQGKTIQKVEEDLKHRRNNAKNEIDKKMYTQILLFVRGTFEFVI